MQLTPEDIDAIWLTLKLASLVTLLLVFICTPIAWWLTRTTSWLRIPVNTITTMPLILPPTVLGFYLLLALGPEGIIGQWFQVLGFQPLPFSFSGLVIASIIYSLPFVVQPLQNAFMAISNKQLEAAATLGASPSDRFIHVVLPLAKPGYISAVILGFAHTVGEFGIVLMIGGNIPNETRVVSVQIYDHVEALEYTQAHTLSFIMVGFSFIVLALLYSSQKHRKKNTLGNWV